MLFRSNGPFTLNSDRKGILEIARKYKSGGNEEYSHNPKSNRKRGRSPSPRGGGHPRVGKKNNRDRSRSRSPVPNKDSKSTGDCLVCGRHHAGKCNYRHHPDANKSNKPWAETDQGKALAALGYEFLPVTKRLSNVSIS